jgi:ADP-heptose:LPS heptosyltransferase
MSFKKNIKNFLVKLSVKLVDASVVLTSFNKPKQPSRGVLLIRTDAIGDYILFRNFIQLLCESKEYGGKKITLIGNQLWRNLVEEFDGHYFEHCIWIHPKRFYTKPFYRYQVLKKIRKQNFEVAISPAFIRTPLVNDALLRNCIATHKITTQGDTTHSEAILAQRNNKYFTQIIKNEQMLIFEWYRNVEIFKQLIPTSTNALTFLRPNLPFKKQESTIVLFIGGSHAYKHWAIENYYKVVSYLLTQATAKITICGGKEDEADAEKLIHLLNSNRVENFCGKTTLQQFVNIVANALLVVTNESNATHIAAAAQVPAVCIANGSEYGKFYPYPTGLGTSIATVCPPVVEQQTFEENVKAYPSQSGLDINSVEPEAVIKLIATIFQKAQL